MENQGKPQKRSKLPKDNTACPSCGKNTFKNAKSLNTHISKRICTIKKPDGTPLMGKRRTSIEMERQKGGDAKKKKWGAKHVEFCAVIIFAIKNRIQTQKPKRTFSRVSTYLRCTLHVGSFGSKHPFVMTASCVDFDVFTDKSRTTFLSLLTISQAL